MSKFNLFILVGLIIECIIFQETHAIDRSIDNLNEMMKSAAERNREGSSSRENWTQNVVKDLCWQDHDYLWLICEDGTFGRSPKKGLITSIHYEYNIGLGSEGYAVAAFHNSQIESEFIRDGDGGFINWSFSCGWNRDASRIYHP